MGPTQKCGELHCEKQMPMTTQPINGIQKFQSTIHQSKEEMQELTVHMLITF
jgi:hypothetical protein